MISLCDLIEIMRDEEYIIITEEGRGEQFRGQVEKYRGYCEDRHIIQLVVDSISLDLDKGSIAITAKKYEECPELAFDGSPLSEKELKSLVATLSGKEEHIEISDDEVNLILNQMEQLGAFK